LAITLIRNKCKIFFFCSIYAASESDRYGLAVCNLPYGIMVCTFHQPVHCCKAVQVIENFCDLLRTWNNDLSCQSMVFSFIWRCLQIDLLAFEQESGNSTSSLIMEM